MRFQPRDLVALVEQRDRAATQQRRPQAGDRRVERQRRGHHRAPLRRRLVRRQRPLQVVRQAAVRDHHALRTTRRSRGVDHIGQMLGQRATRRLRIRHRVEHGRIGIEAQRLERVFGQARTHRRLRQQHPRPAILQHVGQPLSGISRIDRHIGRTGLQHAQQTRHHVEPTPHADRHARIGADAARDQGMGDLVGSRVEPRIAERCLAMPQRHRLRRAPRLRLDHPGQLHRRIRRLAAIPLPHHLRPLGIVQQFQPIQRQRVVAHHRLQHAPQITQEALDRAALEQRRGVFDQSADAPRHLAQFERHVELGRAMHLVEHFQPQPGQVELRAHVVLPREHGLEDRAVREAARRPHDLDHLLERQVLVRLRGQRALARGAQQLGHGGARRHLDAQRERVGEEADQPLHLGARAMRDRAADHHLVLPGQPGEHHRPAGQQAHVERGAVTLAERLERGGQRLVELHRHGVAREVLLGRPRAVGRQLDQGRRARQRGAPVVALRLHHRAAQPAPLPERVVGVLDRQRRQVRRHAAPAGVIGRAEIAREHRDRPAVRDDVMHVHQQHVVVVGEPHQAAADQRPARQVEGDPRLVAAQRLQRGLAIGLAAEIVLAQRETAGRAIDELHRLAVRAGRETGAQPFVAGQHQVQRALQRGLFERAAQAQADQGVISLAAAVELGQEPQPLLREGQRQDRVARRRLDRRQGAAQRAAERLGLLGQARMTEDRREFELDAELAADLRDQLHRRQRMAAQLEEMIVAADPLHPEHGLPDRGELLLGQAARRLVGVRGQRAEFRRGQGVAVDLAVRRERPALDHDQLARHHVVGQALLAIAAQQARARRGGAAQRAQLLQARQGGQRLARLDPVHQAGHLVDIAIDDLPQDRQAARGRADQRGGMRVALEGVVGELVQVLLEEGVDRLRGRGRGHLGRHHALHQRTQQADVLAHVVLERLARLGQGGVVVLAEIGVHHQRHAPRARVVAVLGQAAAVQRDLVGQFLDGLAQQVGQQVCAAAPGISEGFGMSGRGQPQRQLGLDRAREHPHVHRLAVAVGEADGLAGPQRLELADAVAHRVLAALRRVVMRRQREVAHVPARGDGDAGAPAREIVDRRPFLGHALHLVQRQHHAAGAQLDALGAHRQRGIEQRRVRVEAAHRVEVPLGGPDRLEAVAVGVFGRFQVEAVLVGRVMGFRAEVEQAEGQRIGRARGILARLHVADQMRLAGRIAAHRDGGLAHLRMAAEHGLDLGRLDPEAADLDLLVGAADELQRAVGAPAHQVAGAVHALAAAGERIGQETLGAQVGAAQVATRQARAGDVELARHAGRDRLQACVEHVQRGIADRQADRHVARLAHRVHRRPDGGLGRPVHVPDHRHVGQQARGQLRGERLAAAQQRERGVRPAMVGQQAPVRGRGLRQRHAARLDQPGQALGVGGVLARGQHQARAVQQRQVEFERGDVEGQRGQVQHRVVRADAGLHRHRGQQVDQRGMRDLHALGLAGRAGGVDHVGVVRGQRARRRVGGRLLPPDRRVEEQRARHHRLAAERVEAGGVHQQPRRRRVAQHVREPLRRIGRVQRQVGRARLHDAEQADHHLQAAPGTDRHQLVGAHAVGDQVMRQAVGLGVQLGIAERATLEFHRDRLGRAGHLRLEQRRQADLARRVERAGVPAAQQLLALARRQHLQLGDGPLARLLQRLAQAAQHLLDIGGHRRAVERVDRLHRQPETGALDAIVDRQHQRIVGALAGVERAHAFPGRVGLLGIGVVAVVEQRAEQRRRRGHATALLGQRQRRMLVAQQPGQARVSAPQRLAHAVCQADAHRQRVDEQAQRGLRVGQALHAAEQHRAEHHVVAAAGAADHLGPGQVEQARGAHALLAGMMADARGQRGVQFETRLAHVASLALHVLQAERQARFDHVAEHRREEALVRLAAHAQAGLRHVLAERRRLGQLRGAVE